MPSLPLYVLLLLSLSSLLLCSSPTCSPTQRQDCEEDDQQSCENKGCCWDPVNPNPLNQPWCYKASEPFFATCGVSNDDKIDCAPGIPINVTSCLNLGCCWQEISQNPNNYPWCFKPSIAPAPPPGTPPFSSDELDTIMDLFLYNLNYSGVGAVVAARDNNTAAGSYIYHWMRDGGLSMKALMVSNQDNTTVNAYMQKYVNWVLKVQNQPDPNDIDIRSDPKYDLPSGVPNTDPWCRPQSDGPGIRGGTLSIYANNLLDQGDVNYVKSYLWTGDEGIYNGGAIKFDLDWVNDNWPSLSCDLWEDNQNTAFFWNQMNFHFALNTGADLADRLGDHDSASKYRQTASAMEPSINNFYNGQYITECDNRPKDSAVINALNVGYEGDGLFPPTDDRVVQTISVLSDLFTDTFPINYYDTLKGYGGILFGRYEGDVYDGGNPWILSSAALAELHYNTAYYILNGGTPPSKEALDIYAKLFKRGEDKGVIVEEAAEGAFQMGDDILFRIKFHIEDYDLHMSEQIDKYTGLEANAKDLTWSYATVLRAMHYRGRVVGLKQQLEKEKKTL